MKTYMHPTTSGKISGFSSHKEHCFYEETTKRQMFLIIEQMAVLLKDEAQDWVDKAEQEREAIKANGIK